MNHANKDLDKASQIIEAYIKTGYTEIRMPIPMVHNVIAAIETGDKEIAALRAENDRLKKAVKDLTAQSLTRSVIIGKLLEACKEAVEVIADLDADETGDVFVTLLLAIQTVEPNFKAPNDDNEPDTVVVETTCSDCGGHGADPMSDNVNWMPCRKCQGTGKVKR